MKKGGYQPPFFVFEGQNPLGFGNVSFTHPGFFSGRIAAAFEAVRSRRFPEAFPGVMRGFGFGVASSSVQPSFHHQGGVSFIGKKEKTDAKNIPKSGKRKNGFENRFQPRGEPVFFWRLRRYSQDVFRLRVRASERDARVFRGLLRRENGVDGLLGFFVE